MLGAVGTNHAGCGRKPSSLALSTHRIRTRARPAYQPTNQPTNQPTTKKEKGKKEKKKREKGINIQGKEK
jgi:hypothetical protein